jgi:hypothetical protein
VTKQELVALVKLALFAIVGVLSGFAVWILTFVIIFLIYGDNGPPAWLRFFGIPFPHVVVFGALGLWAGYKHVANSRHWKHRV